MENDLVGFENQVIRKVATYADVVYQYVKGVHPQAIADDFEIDVKKVLAVIERAEQAGHLKLTLDQLVAKGATPDGEPARTASLQVNPSAPTAPPAMPAAPTSQPAVSTPVVPAEPETPAAPALPAVPTVPLSVDPSQSTGSQGA